MAYSTGGQTACKAPTAQHATAADHCDVTDFDDMRPAASLCTNIMESISNGISVVLSLHDHIIALACRTGLMNDARNWLSACAAR